MKCYFEYNGQEHVVNNYAELIYNNGVFELFYVPDSSINGQIAIDNYFENKILGLGLNMPKVPEHSEIHVVPECPVTHDDIRKHYTIKRDPDKAEYIVVSGENMLSKFTKYGLNHYYFIEKENLVVCFDDWDTTKRYAEDVLHIKQGFWSLNEDALSDIRHKMFNHAKGTPKIDKDDLIHFRMRSCANIGKALSILIEILDGDIKTPVVSYKNLILGGENEFTTDTAQIILNAASASSYSDREKFYLALKAANQTNWREYQGALDVLGDLIITRFRYVDSHRSEYPKDTREIAKALFRGAKESSFISEKDYNLALELMNGALGFDGTKFTDVTSLLNKLNSKNISKHTFEKVYDNIVRIQPKKINFTNV